MKCSRYNIVSPGATGEILLFNAVSAALAEIDAATAEDVKRLLASPSDIRSESDRELYDQLVYGGFLVSDSEDELSRLAAAHRQQRLNNPTLFLTVAPTLACNFACEYCFERRSGVRMDTRTECALIEFTGRQLPAVDRMYVTWFGGEPTLCLDTIERLQREFRVRCEAAGVELLPASIVTNGYKLNAAVARRLSARGVAEAQVTLDGPPRTHDTRRTLRGGGGTFDRIIENMAGAADHLRLAVRINVDGDNIDDAWEVLELLDRAGLMDKVHPYFAPVNAAETVCADMKGRCFSTEEFARRQVDLYKQLLKRGFSQVDYPEPPSGGHCGADSANSWVVAPNGLLFKCWEELSLEEDASVGSIFEGPGAGPAQRARLDRYLSLDAFDLAECRACNVLPLCLGGCPYQRLQNTPDHKGYCCSWKFNLGEMLQLRHVCEQRKEVKL